MGNIPIEISEMTDDLAELESTIIAIREGIETTSQKDRVNEILEKYGNPRSAIPSLILLEEIIAGMRKDAIDKQRSLIISTIEQFAGIGESSSTHKILKLLVLTVFCFRHFKPQDLLFNAQIQTDAKNFNVKGFLNGILRYPSRQSSNYHFTQLWSPPSPVYTIVSIVEDISGNRVMSSPVSLTSTYGYSPPSVKMTSPISGTQRSVSMVGEHASGEAIQIWTITTWR